MSATGTARLHSDLVPLLDDASKLRPHPENPRNGDVDAIVLSMEQNGVYRPVIAQRSTGYILAGNHTYAALLAQGAEQVPTVWLDCDDREARRILLSDNRTAELGGYDEALLLQNLTALDGDLLGTGYSLDDLTALEQELARIAESELNGDVEDDRAPTTGELLSVADVTVGEPKHTVRHGQVWALGRHRLVVAKLLDEHDQWRELLSGRVFLPYPEPMVTCSALAAEASMLLVQPNRYLAGHLLDKHASVHGEGSVELLSEPT